MAIAEAITPDQAVTRTREDLERLFAVRQRYAEQLVERKRELEQMRSDSGRRVLEATIAGDGADLPRGLGAAAAAMSFEIETLERAEEAAHSAHRDAIAKWNRAREAAGLESAAPLRALMTDLEAQARPHVDALERIWGVPVVPRRPTEEELIAAKQAGTTVPSGLTTIDTLRQEIEQIERQAHAIGAQPVVDQGYCPASTEAGRDVLEELLAAVSDPERVSPTLTEIRAWVADEDAKIAALRARMRREGMDDEAAVPVLYQLTWTRGRIVREESRARLAIPAALNRKGEVLSWQ